MLQDSLFESNVRKKTGKPITVVLSAVAHVVGIIVLLAVPLFRTQALTIPPVDTSLFLPEIDRPQSLPVFTAHRNVRNVAPAGPALPAVLSSPRSIPSTILSVEEPPLMADGSFLGNGGAKGPFFTDGFWKNPIEVEVPSVAPPSPPSPPPPPPPSVPSKPYRLGGGVQAAKLMRQVNPVYPALARQARIQGVVILEAVIGREGSIETLRVISGHPLLTQASLDAVGQWKYRPTILNGEPVEVVTTVTVTFNLQ